MRHLWPKVWRRSVKNTKCWSLHECKGYNALQFITVSEPRLDEEQHQQAAGGSEQSTGVRACSGRRSAHTDENVDTYESLLLESGRQTTEPPNSQRNFTWGGGIHRSSVPRIIHKVLRLKCYKKRRAEQLTEAHSMHALFLVCSLRDDNVITSKPTWKLKHANSILESFEYFCQYRFKIGSFSCDTA